MEPKKMLIKPEKTAEADEKKAAEEAAEVAEEEALQEHYDHVEIFLSEAEKNPEKLKAAGKEREGDDSLIADNATFLSTGVKIVAGKQVSADELSNFSEQAPSVKEVLGESARKSMSEKTPKQRAAIANQLRKIAGDNPIRRRIVEKALKALNIVDSEEPSESDKENA